MNLGRHTIMTEARELIDMYQYNRDIWPSWSHILAPPTEIDSGHKGRKIPWNDGLED